jgi:hypothetical protein
MTLRDVLLPLFVEVILTFVLLFWTAYRRTSGTSSGAAAPRDTAPRDNQLELPMLFYVLTILAWDTHHAGTIFVALAWLFVILQVIEAVIHVTDNDVRRRGFAFIVGAIVLAIMWAFFIVDVVVGT